ncbi:hypothetical protein E9993_07795 [Labilibacter sediminis]|nr:hypothetical protein E9993_07795 [Labilibacter sediminis]
MIRKTSLSITCLVLFFINTTIFGQTESKNVKLYNSAIALADDGDYNQAIGLLKRVADDEPENINVMYNLGYCYMNTTDGPDSASIYFNKAIKLLEEEAYNTDFGIDLHLSMAKCNQLLYQYREAIVVYEKILGFIDERQVDLKDEINRQIETSRNGIELMKNPVKLEVHNLGAEVNSKYDDHSPLVSADESLLLFTSRRISSYSERMADGQFSEKIFFSDFIDEKWNDADILKSIVDRDSHESGVCLSADGTELYILRSDFDGQNLFVSEFDGENWSEPFKLPEGINSRYNETHASINPDKSILFFTSDRKGGYGGLDIYMVRKLPDGRWGTPKNLGSGINSEYDEETPMIHPDGKTLYFSSEGHNSMGKFDIFYCQMNADSSWNEPVNMGYPINTPDDDFFFVPTAARNRAYMASSRFDHNYGGSDLYLIEYEEPVTDRLAVIKGKLQNVSDLGWEDVRVLVKEKGSNELLGEYKPHPATGKYVMILEADKDYDVSIKGEGCEQKDTVISITREMTYLNKQQSVSMGDILIASLPKVVEEKEMEKPVGKYTVQFLTLKRDIEAYDRFKLDESLIKVYECKDGNFRYVFGQFNSFKEAVKAKQEVIKNTGYDDPFVRYFWQLDKLKVEDKVEK